MARRTVRIQSTIEVVIDDGREGIPSTAEVMTALLMACAGIDGVVEVKSGAKFSIGLTRESIEDARRRNRVVRVNSR